MAGEQLACIPLAPSDPRPYFDYGSEIYMDGLPKTGIQPERHLSLEARLIAEAEAEADAGLLIPSDEVNAWIDSLGTSTPLPMPRSAKHRP